MTRHAAPQALRATALLGLALTSVTVGPVGCGGGGAVDPCPQAPLRLPGASSSGPLQASAEPPTDTSGAPAVIVIDHSGSMYGGYRPGLPRGGRPYFIEEPEFQALLAAAPASADGRASIVLFNELAYAWDGARATPLSDGQAALAPALKGPLKGALSAIPAPPYAGDTAGLRAPRAGATDCASTGAGPNCSRMEVGLDGAAAALHAQGGAGLIWLVTDNLYEGRSRGADGLSAAELESNASFYRRLRDDDRVRAVLAWPIHGSPESWLHGSTLFVYGIAWDEASAAPWATLAAPLLSSGTTAALSAYATKGSPSPGQPFRLKPVDQDVVQIRLTALEGAPGKEFGEVVPLKATLTVENTLPHRRIDRLSFTVKSGKWVGFDAADGERMATVTPLCPATGFGTGEITLGPIGPGQTASAEVSFGMPGVTTEWRGAGDLLELAANEKVVMAGGLDAALTEVQTSLAIDGPELQGVYGVESLPGIFADPENIPYTAAFSGQTRPIENPGLLTALLVLGAGGLAAGGVAASLFLLRRAGRELLVDGISQGPVTVGRFPGTPVLARGRPIATARLSLGGDLVLIGANGVLVRTQGRGWLCTSKDGGQVTVELRPLRAAGPASGRGY